MSDTSSRYPKDSPKRQKPGRRQRILHMTSMHALELCALVLALVMVVFGGLAWRLAQGPISLEFLRDDAEAALVKVFDGKSAHIGTLQAGWSAQERTIVFAARNVRVIDHKGRILVQVPEFDVGLTALGLLQGKAVMRRIIAIGGEFSFVRRTDGSINAGLGQPDQIATNPPVAAAGQSPVSNSGMTSLPAVLNRLRVLAMRDVTLHFVDERAGVNWVAPHANIRFSRSGDQLVASASGKVESASGTALVSIDATSRADFSRMNADVKLTNAVPASLLPASNGLWQWIGGIDAPLDAQISFATGEDGLLKSADGQLKLTKGVFRKDGKETPIDSAEVVFVFDPVDGSVAIQLAELKSTLLSGSLKGSLSGLDPARLAIGEKVGFDLAFEGVRLEPDDVFAAPLKINDLWLSGYYLPEQKELDFKNFDINLFDLSLVGSGALFLPDDTRDDDSALFNLTARSDGQITPAQILSLWPVNFAFGGRDWIRRNVLAGRLHDLVLDVRLPQRVLRASRLDNDMLTLSFAFDEAESHFVHAMTPLRDGEGTGVLKGNRFDLQMKRARLMDLQISDGFVEIPRLSPKGVTAHFGGHATGPLRDVVRLLDEEPLGFVSKYGLSPDAITGQGDVDFTISRPMRVEVPVRNVGFKAVGTFKDIRVAGLVVGQDLAGASARFTADPDGLTVEGEGKLGSVPGSFIWKEKFFPKNEPRTQLAIDVVTDEQVFDDLGIPTRLFLDGPVGVHVNATGEGLDIASAKLNIDLTDARLMSLGGDWEKPAGQQGSAELLVQRRQDGGYDITDFKASTEGFVLQGDFSIAAHGGVQSAHIRRASMAGLFDFSAELERSKGGAFILTGNADSLDARGFVRGLTQGASINYGIALDANITFARALASDELILTNGTLNFNKTTQGVEKLEFKALTPNGKAEFSILPDKNGRRHLTGHADDAGLVIQALFGANSVHGGILQVDGVLGDDKGHNTALDLTMNTFKLGDVPVMARMLTLGSLTGIANTMSGEGIGFKRLVAPLEFSDGKLIIGAARATGPALGVTVTGTVDLVNKTMVLTGALAPAYSINSALGNIPVLGGVLVSRKGEGLLGLSYKVQGPFDTLQVFVNPLSALTPGVFRRIFEGGISKVQPASEAAPVTDPGAVPQTAPENPAAKPPVQSDGR